MSLRPRFELRTAAPDCQLCHVYLNGAGFGLEAFDGAGLFRTLDNGKPVNAMGSILGLEDLDGTDDTPYDGAKRLQDLLIEGANVKACFARNLYRFSRGYAETPFDQNTLDNLASLFVASNYNLQELMISMTQLETFTLRRQQP